MNRAVVCLFFVLLPVMISGGEARAHRKAPQRDLLVQWDKKGTAAVVRYTTSGREAALLCASSDLNRDGHIDTREGRMLALVALKKAVAGLTLNVDKGPVAWDLGAAKWQVARATPEAVEVHAVMEWGADRQAARGRLGVSVRPGYGSLGVQVQSLDRWRVLGVDRGAVAKDKRGLKRRLHLHSGEALAVELGRNQGE